MTDTDVNKVTVIVEGLLRQSFMRLMNDEDDSAQSLERPPNDFTIGIRPRLPERRIASR